METAIIAVFAALISSIMALISWWYNRELSKGIISLKDVKIDGNRQDASKLKINFLFLFENVGKETVKITNLHLGHMKLDEANFEQIKKLPILNPMNPGSLFNYSTSFILDLPGNITDEDIKNQLPKLIGKHAIIFVLKYKGTSIFSWRERIMTSYLGYEGYGAVYQLTEDEYKQIEKKLPSDFKLK